MRKYKINVSPTGNPPFSSQEVKGYPVIIADFEEFQFVVHRRIELLCEDQWIVSEVSTGYAFPVDCIGKTRIAAIQKATEKLKNKGKTGFLAVMESARAALEKGKS